jgi:hypothetical protein
MSNCPAVCRCEWFFFSSSRIPISVAWQDKLIREKRRLSIFEDQHRHSHPHPDIGMSRLTLCRTIEIRSNMEFFSISFSNSPRPSIIVQWSIIDSMDSISNERNSSSKSFDNLHITATKPIHSIQPGTFSFFFSLSFLTFPWWSFQEYFIRVEWDSHLINGNLLHRHLLETVSVCVSSAQIPIEVRLRSPKDLL